MATPDIVCPDWLDDGAKAEWKRCVTKKAIDAGHPDFLAAYCFLFSLSQRVREAVKTLEDANRESAAPNPREGLMTAMYELEARLSTTLQVAAAALEIPLEETGRARPTRILILDDEGPESDD